jgi:hypothetical protein
MYHAYKLEKCQEWIGGAISGDIDCSQLKYVVKYDNIPLNKEINEPFKPKYAINWIRIAKQNPDLLKIVIDKSNTCERIDAVSKSIGNIDESVRKKIQNTKNFIEKILDEK